MMMQRGSLLHKLLRGIGWTVVVALFTVVYALSWQFVI